jgi:hypothetical protein
MSTCFEFNIEKKIGHRYDILHFYHVILSHGDRYAYSMIFGISATIFFSDIDIFDKCLISFSCTHSQKCVIHAFNKISSKEEQKLFS